MMVTAGKQRSDDAPRAVAHRRVDGSAGRQQSSKQSHQLRAPLARRLRLPERLARATSTSLLTGTVQLVVFAALDHRPWPPLQADVISLLFTIQLGFILNSIFIWADRLQERRLLLRRWIAFQGSSLSTSLLNLLVFSAARGALPDVAAVALGSSTGAVAGFLLNGRLVFRSSH